MKRLGAVTRCLLRQRYRWRERLSVQPRMRARSTGRRSEGAGSSFSSNWRYNYFFKTGGFDTTVTFIDNVSVRVASTVRGRGRRSSDATGLVSNVKVAHCRAYTGYHLGGCAVTD